MLKTPHRKEGEYTRRAQRSTPAARKQTSGVLQTAAEKAEGDIRFVDGTYNPENKEFTDQASSSDGPCDMFVYQHQARLRAVG